MAHEYTAWGYALGIRGAGRKFVLIALADRANADGYSFPGQKSLAAMTGQSERSVREHLDWLEANGYVRREERRREDGTRTSDAYYLPPMDSTGSIRRWSTTGNNRRLAEEAESADQDKTNPKPATGKSRRKSTGKSLQTNRQISPKSPAESAGHELPEELPEEPPLPPTPKRPPAKPEEEEAGQDLEDLNHNQTTDYRLGSSRSQTGSHLSTFHPQPFKALIDFKRMHDKPVKEAQFKQWSQTILDHCRSHGDQLVTQALTVTTDNFPSLTFPFAFYRKALERLTTESNAPPTTDLPTTALPDSIRDLINNAKAGTL